MKIDNLFPMNLQLFAEGGEGESSGSAEPVVNVEPQVTNPVSTNEPVNAGTGEITPPVVEKPVQTPEENARYATIRRDAEAKARDNTIKEMGITWNGSPINTYAEYQQALHEKQEMESRQQYEQAGINPDLINQIITNNPTVKQASEIIAKQQQEQKINSEIQALFEAYPEAQNEDIPQSVYAESIEKGVPLAYAYSKYAAEKLKAELEEYKKGSQTSKVNSQNAAASTGSTTGNGVNTGDFISKEVFEANRGNQQWVSQNYDLLRNSMNKWR